MARALNILVADDQLSVRHSLSFLLRFSGHSVELAVDGQEALAKVMEQPERFDLLITDNNMPRLSGLELVARLRSLAFRGKIMVLSAHLRDTQEAYRALAVDMMLQKPFDIHELRRAVETLGSADAVTLHN